MAYIETPRTDAGNATFMSNGNNLDFSVDMPFLSPVKRNGNDDILPHMRKGRGPLKTRTPRARAPLTDRHNIPLLPARQEFTPLLQSVTKKNAERSAKFRSGPDTPAFLKGSLRGSDSPALPVTEMSAMYESDFGSSAIGNNDDTPVPQVASSSTQSTPLATLPKREAAGMLNEQGNLMTLREQENIIDKVEKENFGLKLKIHFLEESLRKAGPGFSEVALRENTDLKVDKVTLRKELSYCKKMLSQAERDVDALKGHVEEVQVHAKSKQSEARAHQEMIILKEELGSRKNEVQEMRKRLEATESKIAENEKLKADIDDMEADLREKDRLMDEKDDEVDGLKAQARENLERLEDELDEAKRQIEELEEQKESAAANAGELREAQQALRDSQEAMNKMEADLTELREEMANKSINTKGLSRQIEEKANRLQDDLTALRQQHVDLKESFDDKVRENRRLREEVHNREQEADVQGQRLNDQNELLRNENGALKRKIESLTDQLQAIQEEIKAKSEAKDLLHSRHDALTSESQQLQTDLRRAQATIKDLQREIEEERRRSLDNERLLRSEAQIGNNQLDEVISRLRRELADKESHAAAEKDRWENQRRGLESQKKKAEEQATGLQRTISKLRETEGTLSDRELHLQKALDSEKQRHLNEEAVLEGRVKDLDTNLGEKRQVADELRVEVSRVKEELRMSQKTQTISEAKAQALEDEIEVLQIGFEEEAEKAQAELAAFQAKTSALQSELDSTREQSKESQGSSDHKSEIESLRSRLDEAENQLAKSFEEKQSLQDRSADHSAELHRLQTLISEVEAERDEFHSQIQQMQCQIDDTFKVDQDKLHLRTSKLRLENEVSRLRRDHKSLTEKAEFLQQLVEEEGKKAIAGEAKLVEEIQILQQRLNSTTKANDELSSDTGAKTSRLEARIVELEGHLALMDDNRDGVNDNSVLRKDLSVARQKELQYLQREAAQRDVVKDLKQQVERLERKAHESELARMAEKSPKSVDGSARKEEIQELRRQLTDGQKHLRDARVQSRDNLQAVQKQLRDSQAQVDNLEQSREQLQADLASAHQLQESLQSKIAASTATVARLRNRITSREQDLQTKRRGNAEDDTIAEERRDLHELLKDAKLEAEDLQLQLSSKETAVVNLTAREKELRSHLKRTREARATQEKTASALRVDLDRLQERHERTLERLDQQQRQWEEERRAIVSSVRFPHNSISELHEGETSTKKELEKRHTHELRGLAKQIQWMKVKCHREEEFRAGLAYEKKFLLMQIGMFEACNAADLEILTEMGVNASNNPHILTRLRLAEAAVKNSARNTSESKKTPSLRAVAFALIAQFRMKKAAQKWAEQRKIKESLEKKLEAIRNVRNGRSSAR